VTGWPWQVLFDVAFGVAPSGVPGTLDWTDLSDRLRSSVELSRGRGRHGQSSGEGSADLNNADRALDPTNPSSPYTLLPWRHARFRVQIGEDIFPLWRGFVQSWSPHWPDVTQGLVNTRFVDGFAWLALQDADLDLPRQRTHERITALLDLAGWPEDLRVISEGSVWVDAYEQSSGNIRRVLEDTADAEDGDLYLSPTGRIVFQSRHYRFDAVSEITVGSSGTVPVESVRPSFDDQWLANVARVELASGDVFEAVDGASVAAYGPRMFPIRDLPLNAVASTALAEWVVLRYSEPHLWLDSLTLNGRADGALPALLDLCICDPLTFTHQPPGGGSEFSMLGHVDRITHRIGRGEWHIEWDVSPDLGQGPWFRWDVSDWDDGDRWMP
jgi:hypothetical protein